MGFPAHNQTFQKGNFTDYKVSGARRVASSSFDARLFPGDSFRDPWNTDETLYGPNFAVLDGIGMVGTGKSLDADGLRANHSGWVSLAEWTIDCGNGFAIQGGRGAYLRCPVEVDPGHGIRFVWRFGTTLRSPGHGLDYVGFAMVRFLDKNMKPVIGANSHSYDLLCTTRDLPGFRHFPTFGKLQTDSWQAHSLIHSGPRPLQGHVEWIVSSGHYFQPPNDPNPDKAKAFPCCLAIDHIVLI